MVNVLFVCLGNICRSPLAEAIFKHEIINRKLEGHFFGDSCGTAGYNIGIPPDPRTLKNAQLNGVRIEHLGRQFDPDDFKRFEFILVMDSSNYSNILRLKEAKEHSHKVIMMRAFDHAGQDKDVPDPYYGSDDDFQEVFEMLQRSVDGLIRHLTRNMVLPDRQG